MNCDFWFVFFAFVSVGSSQQYVDETNQVRSANQAAPIAYNSKLENAAKKHNSQMISGNCFSHQCSGEPPLETRIENENYDWGSAAENIAKGYADWKSCVSAWMNSTGHRKNLLGNYAHLGCALDKSSNDNNNYFTCVYASPI